jgi:hypothetical protein
MSGHDVPNPVELAVQETVAAYAEELRTHVELARAWRAGGPGAKPSPVTQQAWYDAKRKYQAAMMRLREALDVERMWPPPRPPGVQDEP